MLMTWHRDIPCEVLRHWIHTSSAPMLISKYSGKILCCNPATERLLGYTSEEFAADRAGWDSLTNSADLEIDKVLAKQVALGERDQYNMLKTYKTKSGANVEVDICVGLSPETPPVLVDSPEALETVDFLVTAIPVGQHQASFVRELAQVRLDLAEIRTSLMNRPSLFGVWEEIKVVVVYLMEWAKQNKIASAAIMLTLGALLLGSEFQETVEWAFSLMGFRRQ